MSGKGTSNASASGAGAGGGDAPAASSSSSGKLHIVVKLTEELLHTYKDINKKYYEKKRKRQAEAAKQKSGDRNANYDYRIKLHEKLDNRFRVMESIGKGSFGQVVRAYDELEQKPVAIKIIKNKDAFRIQAKSEMELLKLLNVHDPGDQWSIVRMKHTFMHHGHTCLVFELLSINLYQLLRRTSFQGVSLNLVRKFARQILKTLAYLSLEDVNVIHCDLKPENILFVQPNRSAIKVIDFGSSCRANQPMYTYIQSRFYRSPEVILGLPYSTPIDMWSLGCILVEMHTGTPLFSGRDQQDQMSRFVALLGLPPKHMLDRGRKTHHFFEFVRVAHPDSSSGSDSDSSCDSGSHSSSSGTTCDSDSAFNSSAMSDLSDSDGSSPDDSSKPSAAVADGASGAGGSKASDDRSAARRAARRRRQRRASRSRSRSRSQGGASGRRRRRRRRPRPHFHEYYQLRAFVRQGTSPVHTSLAKVLGVNTGGPGGRRKHEVTGHTAAHYRHFMDLVLQMLEYDPSRRIKPMQALNHPFLREDIRAAAGSTSSTGAKAVAGAGSGAGASSATGAGAGAGAGGGSGVAAATAASASADKLTGTTAPAAAGGAPASEASAGAGGGAVAGVGATGDVDMTASTPPTAAPPQGQIAYLHSGSGGHPALLMFQPPGAKRAPGASGPSALVLSPLPSTSTVPVAAVPICVLPSGVSLPAGVAALPANVTPVVLPGALPAGTVVTMGAITAQGGPTMYYELRPVDASSGGAPWAAVAAAAGVTLPAPSTGGPSSAHAAATVRASAAPGATT